MGASVPAALLADAALGGCVVTRLAARAAFAKHKRSMVRWCMLKPVLEKRETLPRSQEGTRILPCPPCLHAEDEREGRFRVYVEAPGFRTAPRETRDDS